MNDICFQNNENMEYRWLQNFDTNMLQDRIEGKGAEILMYLNIDEQ